MVGSDLGIAACGWQRRREHKLQRRPHYSRGKDTLDR